MIAIDLIETALKLVPAERFALAEEILHNLDKPDPEIDRNWIEEAQRRLEAHRAGAVLGIHANEIFPEL